MGYCVGLIWQGFGSGGLRLHKGPSAGQCRKRAEGTPHTGDPCGPGEAHYGAGCPPTLPIALVCYQ